MGNVHHLKLAEFIEEEATTEVPWASAATAFVAMKKRAAAEFEPEEANLSERAYGLMDRMISEKLASQIRCLEQGLDKLAETEGIHARYFLNRMSALQQPVHLEEVSNIKLAAMKERSIVTMQHLYDELGNDPSRFTVGEFLREDMASLGKLASLEETQEKHASFSKKAIALARVKGRVKQAAPQMLLSAIYRGDIEEAKKGRIALQTMRQQKLEQERSGKGGVIRRWLARGAPKALANDIASHDVYINARTKKAQGSAISGGTLRGPDPSGMRPRHEVRDAGQYTYHDNKDEGQPKSSKTSSILGSGRLDHELLKRFAKVAPKAVKKIRPKTDAVISRAAKEMEAAAYLGRKVFGKERAYLGGRAGRDWTPQQIRADLRATMFKQKTSGEKVAVIGPMAELSGLGLPSAAGYALGRQEVPSSYAATKREANKRYGIGKALLIPGYTGYHYGSKSKAKEVLESIKEEEEKIHAIMGNTTFKSLRTKKAALKVVKLMKLAAEAGMSVEQYVGAEQQAQAQMEQNELQQVRQVAERATQENQALSERATQAEQQLQELQQNLQLSQQQGQMATQQAADAEANAAEQSNAKLRMKMKIDQMRQTLADLAAVNPQMDEAPGPEAGMPQPGAPAGPVQQQADATQAAAQQPQTAEQAKQQQQAQRAQQKAQQQTQQAQQLGGAAQAPGAAQAASAPNVPGAPGAPQVPTA